MTLCAGDCGRDLRPGDKSVAREVVGWSKPRAGGGVNAISGRRETGRLMCPGCLRKLRDTGMTTQGTLL